MSKWLKVVHGALLMAYMAKPLISLQAPTSSLTTVQDLIALKLRYISMQLLLPPV